MFTSRSALTALGRSSICISGTDESLNRKIEVKHFGSIPCVKLEVNHLVIKRGTVKGLYTFLDFKTFLQ